VKISRRARCKAEEAVAEEAQQRLQRAQRRLVEEIRNAEESLLLSTDERVHNWSDLRTAQEQVQWWKEAVAAAEKGVESVSGEAP